MLHNEDFEDKLNKATIYTILPHFPFICDLGDCVI